ncbi:MAG: IS1182 family transposase [Gammaproteobacteria bacterium]
MTIARWTPPVAPTRQEQFILKRLGRVRKLLGFLRLHRHELFDDAFQDELAAMYRTTGAGKEARPPALMAMAMLVQGYLGISDAEMIELTVVDLRVQMVLGCLGAEAPPFSQGALQEFRERLIAADLDRRVLERTVDLAQQTKAFDPRKLPKTLRVAIDSSPLEGAGRVEDTYNLLAHAARNVVRCAARVLGWPVARVCEEAGIPLLAGPSIKAALDIDWNDAGEKAAALTTFVRQLDALQAWLERHLPEDIAAPPLQAHLETLAQIRTQDLEPDPGGSGLRLRDGVAADRRVSVADTQMRHGRKSKSKRFNGFKRHIAADVDRGLILACAITPANRPEEEAIPSLQTDLARQALTVDQLLIDRGYINSTLVDDVLTRRGKIVCKPWKAHNGQLFPKSAFRLNLRDRTITCPNGQVHPIAFGTVVEFDPDICDHCTRRTQCTTAELGNGRTVAIAENEALQQRLRKQIQTSAGRAALRERTTIEHKLAHISQRQGTHARYVGVRKNTFDLRRASAIQNLEALHRSEIESRNAA